MFAMTDDENFRNALLRAMAPLLVETGEVLIQQVLATKPTEASQTFWATNPPTGAAWALEAARHPLMVLAARSLGCAQGKSGDLMYLVTQGTLEVMVGWVFEMPVRFHANDKGTDAVLEGGGVFCKGKNSGFAWTTTCGEPIGRGNGKQRVEVLVGDCDEHSASFGIVAPTADRNELLGFLQPGSIALFANGSLFIDGKRDSRTRGFGEGDSLTLSVSPSIVEPSSFQVIYGINGEEVYRREDVSAGWNFAFGGYGNFTNYKIIDPTPEPPPPPPPVRRRAEREQASAQQ